MNDNINFEDFMENADFSEPTFSIGDRIERSIVAIDKDNIFIDLGTRMEAVVPREEFTTDGELTVKTGDTITVFITGRKRGIFQCARRLAGRGRSGSNDNPATKALEDAAGKGIPVEGKVVKVIDGKGFEVEVTGQKAFCPVSKIDTRYCENPGEHLNKSYSFKIIKFENNGRNIVVSRRELLEEEARQKADAVWAEIEEGKIYDGKITRVMQYGAFVDIGGLEGLLHVSEISWDRVDDATKVLKSGEEVRVSVKNLDPEAGKVGFSMKALIEDPWEVAVKEINPGDVFKGKVTRLKNFGAFVEIKAGLEGLLHISEISSDKRLRHPKEALNVDQEVAVTVLSIDRGAKKISLTVEKEKSDYSQDLEKLNKDQAETSASSVTMAGLFDAALKK